MPDDCRKNINEKVRIKLDLIPPYIVPCLTSRGRSHLIDENQISHHLPPIVETLHKYYTNVFSWIKANPSLDEIVEAMRSVYVFKDKTDTEPNNLVNTKEGHDHFISVLKNNKYETIFIKGPRGAGKSFYLNFVMNTEIDNLYNNNQYVWYRLDISKIYKRNISIYKKSTENKNLWTINKYLLLHVIYVSFVYRERTALWRTIFSVKNNRFLKVLSTVCSKDNTVVNLNKLKAEYKSIISNIKIRDIAKSDTRSIKNDIFDYLVSMNGAIDYESLSTAILIYTLKEGYRPIFVFDGIDNIEYHSNTKLYNNFMLELITYCFTDDKGNPFSSKVIISLRNETFTHLRKLCSDYFSQKSEIFQIRKHNVRAIISRKADIAITPNCSYFASIKNKTNFQDELDKLSEKDKKDINCSSITEYDKQFKSFAESYMDKMINSINNSIPHNLKNIYRLETDEDFLEKFYNWNLRQFIYNFINVYKYVMLWKIKKNYTSDKEYLYSEALLLNGAIYLKSADKYDFGQSIPNIFWFDSNYSHNIWHGLCLYRILQLLGDYDLTKMETYSYMMDIFGYSREIISERFDKGIIYGLISCEYSPDEEKIIFSTTEKGKFLQQYVLFDINLFYFLSIDTPLIKKAVYTSSMVMFHDNTKLYWENYIEACLLTSITMIRHIITQNKNEQLLWDRYGDKYRSTFGLPDSFPQSLINGMMGQFNSLRKQTHGPYRCEVLKKNIEGLK